MSTDKKLYLFANWKMYLDVLESRSLAKFYTNLRYPAESKVAIFPSALSYLEVQKMVQDTHIQLGAQNTFWADKGGYTGEISAAMYKTIGAGYALVGHAERRHVFHESNHDVRMKLEAMLQLPLTPVVCVGETLSERKKGETEEVLEAQIRAAFMDITWPESVEVIVAYEPVWAIGTGESCDPKEADRIAEKISTWTEKLVGKKPVILYGGSVRGENIVSYLKGPMCGVLVGGASAKSESWSELISKLK
jgi:triosephosphate isomerase